MSPLYKEETSTLEGDEQTVEKDLVEGIGLELFL